MSEHSAPVFSFYAPGDFDRVVRFLSDIPDSDLQPYGRVSWQFAYGLHPGFVSGGSTELFERTCGIWTDEAGIAAMVLTEGNNEGETYLAFRSPEVKTPELLSRMFDYAERFTSKTSANDGTDEHRYYHLAIADDDVAVQVFAEKRGYHKTDWTGDEMVKHYPAEPETVELPEGFTVTDTNSTPPIMSAIAHTQSFGGDLTSGHYGPASAFAYLRTMPDYRPDLDLLLLNAEGQPAGLATFWVTDKSPLAVLEPLGIVPWYQGQGLGRALVTEGINRTRKYGCTAVTGGDGPFYTSLGFHRAPSYTIWDWSDKPAS